MKLQHYICDECAEGKGGVLRDLMPVFFACCFCGELTAGQVIELEDAPCDGTCVSEWLLPREPNHPYKHRQSY